MRSTAVTGRPGIDRQRRDRARDGLDGRQVARVLAVEGAVQVQRRIEVLAGVDAFGREHRDEVVAAHAEHVARRR